MTKLHLIRHAEPMYDMIDARKLGKAERDFVPLTARGIEQAEMVAADSRLQNVELIVSSPYTRAMQTAAIISRRVNVPIQVEFDLYEWTPDINGEIGSKEELDAVHRDFQAHNGVYPDGEVRIWESRESVLNRVNPILDKYRGASEIAVVCHGMIMAFLAGLSHQVPYCGVLEIQR